MGDDPVLRCRRCPRFERASKSRRNRSRAAAGVSPESRILARGGAARECSGELPPRPGSPWRSVEDRSGDLSIAINEQQRQRETRRGDQSDARGAARAEFAVPRIASRAAMRAARSAVREPVNTRNPKARGGHCVKQPATSATVGRQACRSQAKGTAIPSLVVGVDRAAKTIAGREGANLCMMTSATSPKPKQMTRTRSPAGSCRERKTGRRPRRPPATSWQRPTPA